MKEIMNTCNLFNHKEQLTVDTSPVLNSMSLQRSMALLATIWQSEWVSV